MSGRVSCALPIECAQHFVTGTCTHTGPKRRLRSYADAENAAGGWTRLDGGAGNEHDDACFRGARAPRLRRA